MVHAQIIPPQTNITWSGIVNLVTTTNVTYAKYMWFLPCCQSIAGTGPLIRTGNTFWYDFDIEGPEFCQCQSILIEDTTTTLGTLVPGAYTLITTSWGAPVATNTFTVTPVLQPIGFDTNGFFQIQMSSGVTNVNYVLQYSTDFVNWNSLSTNTVSTNVVGVALTDYYSVSPIGFYRVLCQ